MPHEPDPPDLLRLIPDWDMFVRGLGLGGLAIMAALAARRTFRRWWLMPLAVPLAATSFLAAWAAAIHITGGEKFDDHPWV
jgi:hypothetical protein